MNLTYTMQGDYLIPDLIPPEAPKLGKFGMQRRSYLMNNRKGLYEAMLLSNKLSQHLEEIDRQGTEMMAQLMKQMAQSEGVTEALKASDQMKWVQMMNSIRIRAEEQVRSDLIYS